MRISYELASLNLTFVYFLLLCVSEAPFLIVANINICTFSFDASSKFGLHFTITIIRLGSMSLNLSKVTSFSIFLCQFRIYLIILHNSIKSVFSVISSSIVDFHFFILKISRIEPCFTFRVTLNVFFYFTN